MNLALDIAQLSMPVMVLIGTFIAWRSFQHAQKAQRQANTTALVAHLSTIPDLEKADQRVHELVNCQTDHKKSVELSGTDYACLTRVLNFYEFLCASMHDKALEPKVVQHLRGGMMCATFDYSQPLIKKLREELKRDEVYRDFEKAVLSFKQVSADKHSAGETT